MPEFDPTQPYEVLSKPVVTRGSTFGWQEGPGSDSGDNGRFAGGGSSLNDQEDYAALPDGSDVPYGYHFQVRNPDNGAIVWVTRRDKGPAKWTGRGVDLAPSAMRKLGAQTDDPLVVDTKGAVPPFDPTKPYETVTKQEVKAPDELAPIGKIIGVAESPPPAESTTQKIMDFLKKPSPEWMQPIEKAITSPIPGAAAAIHAGYQYGSPLGWVEDIAPNSDAGKLAHDIRQQLEQTATGFATPANLALGATTAGVPSAIGRLVGAGFTVAQAKDALDTYDQYQSATDPDQKRQLGIRLGVSGAMTALLGGATLMPHPVGKPKVEGTERGEAAAPAENPASSQSTILENATQAEPPLDVKGTPEMARFQGEEVPTTSDLTRQAADWQAGLLDEGSKLGEQMDTMREAGQLIPGPLIDRIDHINAELEAGFKPEKTELTPRAREDIGAEIPEEPSANGQTPLVQPQAAGVSVQPNTPEAVVPNNIPTRTAGESSNGTRSPEAAPVPEPSQLEPTQTGEPAQAPIGAAARVAAARDEAGLLGEEGAPESGRGIGYATSVAEGNALLDKGTDPYKVASDFQKNGLINRQRMGVMRAHLERLQLANSRARGALEAAPHDLKLKRVAGDAQDAENAFWRAYKPMQTEWSNIGTGMKESRSITDADVHSQTIAEQAMRESLGRELTPKDQQRAARAVKSVKEANGAVEKAWGKAVESASKKAKGKPMEYGDLAKSLAEKLKEITCQ